MKKCGVNLTCKGKKAEWWFYVAERPMFTEVWDDKPHKTAAPCCEDCRLKIVRKTLARKKKPTGFARHPGLGICASCDGIGDGGILENCPNCHGVGWTVYGYPVKLYNHAKNLIDQQVAGTLKPERHGKPVI